MAGTCLVVPAAPQAVAGPAARGFRAPQPRGPSPAELERRRQEKERQEREEERQRRLQQAHDLNDSGVRFYDQGDWEAAADYFRRALELNPTDSVIRQNVRNAESKLEAKRERERRMEARKAARRDHQRELDESKAKIGRMLDDLSEQFGSSPPPVSSTARSGSLEFIGPSEPLFSKGTKSSAPVDLRFMEANKPAAVDPRALKETADDRAHALTVKALNCSQGGDEECAIRHFRAALKERPDDRGIQLALGHALYLRDKGRMKGSPKAEILLDALEHGRGDWEASIAYLKDAQAGKQDKEKAQAARDALNYTEGLYAYHQYATSEGPASATAAPLDDRTHDLTVKALNRSMKGDQEGAIRYFQEALEARPNDRGIQLALGQALYLRDKQSGQRPSPKAEALLDALERGKGDGEASIGYLKESLAKETDKEKAQAYRDALNYSEGLYGYKKVATSEAAATPTAPPLDDRTHALTVKALNRSMKGDYEGAIRYFKEALKASPNDQGIRDTLNFTEGMYIAQQQKAGAAK